MSDSPGAVPRRRKTALMVMGGLLILVWILTVILLVGGHTGWFQLALAIVLTVVFVAVWVRQRRAQGSG